ncbi:MAG: 2-phospho-L-lactate guanylyltransferase [Chthoniobacterales bacterium]
MNELIFEVTQEIDGGFVAECLTESIVTQGDDWVSLKASVTEAVRGFFFDQPERAICNIRLHLIRDEAFVLA